MRAKLAAALAFWLLGIAIFARVAEEHPATLPSDALSGPLDTAFALLPSPLPSLTPSVPLPAPPPPNQVPPPVVRVPGQGSMVALTFDVEGGGCVAPILDALALRGAKASFAVVGRWAQAHPHLLQRMAREGHVIMNHSYSHPDFVLIPTEQRLWELEQTDAVVRSATGLSTKPFFRPPYGRYDAFVAADAASAGYRIVMWDVDAQGWRGKSKEEVVALTLHNVRPGSIVLLHPASSSECAAAPDIIAALADAGYTLVTLAQLLGLASPPQAPAPTPPPPPPSPTPSPPTPTRTPTPTPTPILTPVPTPSPTPTPPNTPVPSPSPSPSPTAGPTSTPATTPSP